MVYGTKVTITAVVRHPKNKTAIRSERIFLWGLKRDTEFALFNLPCPTKTRTVLCVVNGRKAKLDSVSTDGTARFIRL